MPLFNVCAVAIEATAQSTMVDKTFLMITYLVSWVVRCYIRVRVHLVDWDRQPLVLVVYKSLEVGHRDKLLECRISCSQLLEA